MAVFKAESGRRICRCRYLPFLQRHSSKASYAALEGTATNLEIERETDDSGNNRARF